MIIFGLLAACVVVGAALFRWVKTQQQRGGKFIRRRVCLLGLGFSALVLFTIMQLIDPLCRLLTGANYFPPEGQAQFAIVMRAIPILLGFNASLNWVVFNLTRQPRR